MPPGRPGKGSDHVTALAGSPGEVERLRVILDTIGGSLSIEQACDRLGIGPARLHQLRHVALQGALDALAPKPAGRPREASPEQDARVRELQDQVEQLTVELQAALVRTEIALAMPGLLKATGKKNSRRHPH